MIFGHKIEISPFEENNLSEIVRKRGEREIMCRFLDGVSFDGQVRQTEIIQKARKSVSLDEPQDNHGVDQAAEFFAKSLKVARTDVGLSLYDDIKLRIVEQLDRGKIGSHARKARLTGSKEGLTLGLPERLKEAEAILTGKIRSDLKPGDIVAYQVQLETRRLISVVAQDLFFAVNNRLNPEQSKRFMAILYELRKEQAAPFPNPQEVRQIIARTISGGSRLEMVHIKCPRYCYPDGKRLEIVGHCEDETVKTKDGQILKTKEDGLFLRLSEVRQIFLAYGIKVQLKILIMDQDVSDHLVPKDNFLLAVSDLGRIKTALGEYRTAVEKKVIDPETEVDFFREHLGRLGLIDEFDSTREKILRDLYRGTSFLPEGLVESKVNTDYERNRGRFATDPGRQFSRDTAYAKLATTQALGVLRRGAEGTNSIFVEEDRGNEDNYIGGIRSRALPIYFTRLRG